MKYETIVGVTVGIAKVGVEDGATAGMTVGDKGIVGASVGDGVAVAGIRGDEITVGMDHVSPLSAEYI